MSILPSSRVTSCQRIVQHVYGEDYQPQRKGKRGRYPAKQRIPLPELL